MGRLIDISNIRVNPQYMQDVMGIAMIRCEDLSRILADVPTVEAIPKDQYEARLKADVVAMLTEIQLEIEECGVEDSHWIIKEKINALNDGNIITNIDKFKEVFANLPVSLDAQKRLVIDDNDIPYGFWEQEYKKEEKK